MVAFRAAVKPSGARHDPVRNRTASVAICPVPDMSPVARGLRSATYRLAWIMLLLALGIAFDKALPSGVVSCITKTPEEGDAQ